MFINAGAWEPDAATLGADILVTARNALPTKSSWGPLPAPVAQNASAMPGTPCGMFYVQRADGQFDTYGGNSTQLLKYDSASQTWDDVSRTTGGAYAVPDGNFWDFEQFGSDLVATNGFDAVQVIDVDSGSNFAALGGSPPVAAYVTAVGDQLVLSGLLNDPYAIQWSDINDITVWTAGGGSLADRQEFSGFGKPLIVCAESRMIIMERGLKLMNPTGDKASFFFDDIANAKGTQAPYGVIQIGGLSFWISEDGFYVGNSGEQRNISSNRVTSWFFDELNRTRLRQVYGAFDPFGTRVYWSFPSGDTDYNDRLLGYDWSLDRWFHGDVEAYILGRTAMAGTTLEGLDSLGDLDSLDFSLDSRLLLGGAPALACIGEDKLLSYFEGEPLPALFESGDYQLIPGRRARVQQTFPMFTGSDAAASAATVRVGRRKKLSDAISWSTAATRQESGAHKHNAGGRFHRFEFAPGTGTWEHFQGMDETSVEDAGR